MIKQINNINSKNTDNSKFKEFSHRIGDSSVIAANNDSDIVDIANLLREKDGYFPL